MKNLFKRKNRKLYATAALLTLLSAYIIIFPANSRSKELNKEIYQANLLIKQIENDKERLVPVDQRISELKTMKTELSNIFPDHEEESIGLLTQLAKNNSLEILSLRPEIKKSITTQSKTPLDIDGKEFGSIFISIKMKGNYEHLMEYLKNVREKIPSLITIESMRLTQTEETENNLTITLNLNVYVAS